MWCLMRWWKRSFRTLHAGGVNELGPDGVLAELTKRSTGS